MLTVWGSGQRFCDGRSRRDFLRVGALGGALSLSDLLRLRAQGTPAGTSSHKSVSRKSVIMVCLNGGPSHIDMYDLKPEAPAELRGEFRPIQTNVPGFDISELMPLQARIADKLALVRSVQWPLDDGHHLHLVFSGFPKSAARPSFGSIVSRVRSERDKRNPLPPYVSMAQFPTHPVLVGHEEPSYLGSAYRAFVPYEAGAMVAGQINYTGPGAGAVKNLEPTLGITRDRLANRSTLLQGLDKLRREIDAQGEMAGIDAFTVRALDMVGSRQVREAFDISREPPEVQAKYGGDVVCKNDPDRRRCWEGSKFLQARRLVEAGVPVVTLAVGVWDTHSDHFTYQRDNLPLLDRSLHALVTDLHERGLDKDVAVVVCGEMGRTPRINKTAGRDHWPSAGFALFGGGLRMGQVVGATDARGERPKTRPYTPQNILATLYHFLGIDPTLTFLDHAGRPRYVLDDQEKIAELI
ncbi:MAG: DUF1501 domain-containing protein [Planctomycetia bacterium]|nr:DUF1501 domain-containing protein [Planctomycetia bacterium]